MADFGSEVRRLLSERDMSLRELARRAHCDAGYLSKMVNGRKPAPSRMAAILDDVLGGDGALTEAAAVPRLSRVPLNFGGGPVIIMPLSASHSGLRH